MPSMVKTLLKKMQETYAQSKKQARRIPGGEYLLQVQKCKLEEKDQQVKGVVEYYVLEGEEEGCVQREQYQITEKGFIFLIRFIENMGYAAPDDSADVEEVFAAIQEERPVIRAKIVPDGQYNRVYFQELVGDGTTYLAPNVETAAETVDESEAPVSETVEEETATPAKSSKVEKKPAAATPTEIVVGSRVSVVFDGQEFEGQITDVKDTGEADVLFDDGDEMPVPFENITIKKGVTTAPAEAVEETNPIVVKKGDRVSFEDEGTVYIGTVSKVNKAEEIANIALDDDAGEAEVTFSELTLVTEEVAEETDPMLAELIEFAQAQGIELAGVDTTSAETMVSEVSGYEIEKANLTKSEVALLEHFGIPMKEAEAPKPKAIPKKATPKAAPAKVVSKKVKKVAAKAAPVTKKAATAKKVVKK